MKRNAVFKYLFSKTHNFIKKSPNRQWKLVVLCLVSQTSWFLIIPFAFHSSSEPQRCALHPPPTADSFINWRILTLAFQTWRKSRFKVPWAAVGSPVCETSNQNPLRLLAGTHRRPSAVSISLLHYLCINSGLMWPQSWADKHPAASNLCQTPCEPQAGLTCLSQILVLFSTCSYAGTRFLTLSR